MALKEITPKKRKKMDKIIGEYLPHEVAIGTNEIEDGRRLLRMMEAKEWCTENLAPFFTFDPDNGQSCYDTKGLYDLGNDGIFRFAKKKHAMEFKLIFGG